MNADEDVLVEVISIPGIMDKILDLFPAEHIPRAMYEPMMSIFRDLAMLSGHVQALQMTAGPVFAAARAGNYAPAEAFFEVLTSISTMEATP